MTRFVNSIRVGRAARRTAAGWLAIGLAAFGILVMLAYSGLGCVAGLCGAALVVGLASDSVGTGTFVAIAAGVVAVILGLRAIDHARGRRAGTSSQ